MKSLVLVALSVTAFAQVADFDDDAFAEGEPFEVEQVGSVEAFEPSLAPYGEWVWLNNVRVFRPSVSVVGGGLHSVHHARAVGEDRGGLVICQHAAVRLGDLPLRALVARAGLGLGVGARHHLGAGVGRLALRWRVRRLGALAAALCPRPPASLVLR